MLFCMKYGHCLTAPDVQNHRGHRDLKGRSTIGLEERKQEGAHHHLRCYESTPDNHELPSDRTGQADRTRHNVFPETTTKRFGYECERTRRIVALIENSKNCHTGLQTGLSELFPTFTGNEPVCTRASLFFLGTCRELR